MRLPPELEQQLAGKPGAVKMRSVTMFAVEHEGGGVSYICTGSVIQDATDSGVQLASPQARILSEAEVFDLITTYLKVVLVNGSLRPATPQIALPAGALN